jgi:hypothetical protein
MWARTWEETQGGKYPPSEHHPRCPEFIAIPFSVLTLDGTSCVCTPREAEQIIADDDAPYVLSTVMLTQDQADKMEDFAGF